jgi:hypothetical protein
MSQHRSKLALQAMNVIAPNPADPTATVPPKRKRKGTGVIVIDGSDSEEHEEEGSESDDSETERMLARLADLQVRHCFLPCSKDTAHPPAKVAISQ